MLGDGVDVIWICDCEYLGDCLFFVDVWGVRTWDALWHKSCSIQTLEYNIGFHIDFWSSQKVDCCGEGYAGLHFSCWKKWWDLQTWIGSDVSSLSGAK